MASSSHEVGTFTNFRCYSIPWIPCLEVDKAPPEVQIMAEFLCHHDLNIPLTKKAQVPISLVQRAYHTARYLKEEDCVEFYVDAEISMKVDKSRFLKAIGFPDLPKEERNIKEPTKDELFDMLEKMNYLGGRLQKTKDFRKTKLPVVWQYLIHILLRCLSGKSGGTDTLNRGTLCILYGLYYDMDVDIGDILWKDFTYFIEPKKAELPSGRFWGLILRLCYKELNLEMPKGELIVFRIIKFPVPDQSFFRVVNPIPKDMLKYIPTTSTVLSSYLKSMDQSKPAEPSKATPSGKGNTKRQNLGTTTVTGTLKRKHESSRNSPVKRPTKKPTPPTPSILNARNTILDARKSVLDARKSILDAELAELDRQQIHKGLREEAKKTTLHERGRKATEESLKLIQEERQKKLEQEEIERKSFEESEKKKKTDEGQGDTDEDVLEVNFAEGAKYVAPEDDSSRSGFTLFTKIDDENKIFLDDSSDESTKRSEEIKTSQGTSEGFSKTRNCSKCRNHKRGSKYVSKKKFKQMEKTLNDVLEFVKHIPTAADVYTPRADFTKLLDTVTLLSKTVEDMNVRQLKLHDEMSTTVAKEAMIVMDKLNTVVNAVNNWQKLYDSSLNSLGKTHGEEINRFSTQNSELRKQNIVLHSVVVKLLKSLEILAKPTPQPSEVLSILRSMQTTVEDLPKQLSSELLKKHFDEAFAKLFALMTDSKVFGQECRPSSLKWGEDGSSQGPIVISKEPTSAPLTIPGSSIFGEDKEKGGEADEEEKEVVVEKVQIPPSCSPQQIEEPKGGEADEEGKEEVVEKVQKLPSRSSQQIEEPEGGEADEEEKEEIVVEKVQKPPDLPPQQIEALEVISDTEKPEGGPKTSPPEKDNGKKPMTADALEHEKKEKEEDERRT